jgi:hypothetical protein
MAADRLVEDLPPWERYWAPDPPDFSSQAIAADGASAQSVSPPASNVLPVPTPDAPAGGSLRHLLQAILGLGAAPAAQQAQRPISSDDILATPPSQRRQLPQEHVRQMLQELGDR